MYLEKRTYVKNWEHNKVKYEIIAKKGGEIMKEINPNKVSYIIEEVGYWRKANQIHKWFVDNVVSSQDWNGESVYVSFEQLKELLETCKKVLKASKLIKGKIKNGSTWTREKGHVDNIEDGKVIKDPKVAQELLPTEEGFFFGSTDYDEYYLADITDTIKILGDLKEEDCGDYYYSASW